MMNPKKSNVLFIVTKSEPGGAQKFVHEQMLILEDEFNLFLATDMPGWLFEISNDRLSNSLLDNRIKSLSFTYLLKVIKFIQNNDIDLIICNSANGGLYGRIAAFLLKRKSIYVSHGWSSTYRGKKLAFFFNKIEKLLSTISSSILCISENDTVIAQTKILIKLSSIKTISNKTFSIKSNSTINVKDSTNKIVRILTVARLDYPKRLDLLIEAFGNIENVEVYIVGGGAQEGMLRNLIGKNLINNIFLLGTISSFSDFRNYDFFVLLSNSEGLPMSAIEAMSCELPLILSDVGGCKELIRNNGILVQNEISSIREGLAECIRNREKFRTESISLFNEKFNLELNKQEYINYYHSILSK
ncbi:glycosyl transferase [Dyadobacter frigoris]|uniref:glycosyltransferase n=1 Tax=Dyadobacter frigoris TaxID=2576211 RepID=UPI0024A2A466|nr:glycosyltransferase [Dyadobacter frigoris]GLU54922.1 glycosyl transferase [Dyadobacter frigoris]